MEVITISMENTKMGCVPSFSLPPVVSCNAAAQCTKSGCYMKRLLKIRPSWKRSVDKNYKIVTEHLDDFYRQLNGWLSMYQPKAFRFHVSGDFFSYDYLDICVAIARNNPKVKFFAFTKQWDIIYQYDKDFGFPNNFSIILSAWLPRMKDWKPPRALALKFPVAYVNKHNDEEGLADILYTMRGFRNGRYKYNVCYGVCDECGMCFNRKRKDGDIMFEYH